MLFSERYGFKPVKDVFQVDSMDEDLRNGLWNVLDLYCFGVLRNRNKSHRIELLCSRLWMHFFKEPIDQVPRSPWELYSELRRRYFRFTWNEVYDFLEFVVANDDRLDEQEFIHACNGILERELSAYRFVGKQIVQITDQVEIDAIEEALHKTSSIEGAKAHIHQALELFSDREDPDYRNSIKESISAVEAVAQIISGDPNATLGDALNAIEKAGKVRLHTALKQGFEKLYGWTSDADGIRHAMTEESNVTFDDAKFMLVSCSAFVNYLIAKSQEAGIDLTPDQ